MSCKCSFQNIFCLSFHLAFVVWAINELKKLGEIVRSTVFQNSDDFQTMGKCLQIVFDHSVMVQFVTILKVKIIFVL